MTTRWHGVWIAWMLAAAPAVAAPRIARPPEVLGVAVRSAPDAYDGLRAFAGSFGQPVPADVDSLALRGIAALVDADALDGVDHAQPVYLLLVHESQREAGVVVVGVADPKALAAGAGKATIAARGAWAVVGPKAAVDRVSAYALSTLLATTPPHGLTATIYPELLARFHDQIAAARGRVTAMYNAPSALQFGQIMTSYFDGLVSVAADAQELRLTLDGDADGAWLDAAFVPVRGSRLGKFVALQQPSDFALFDKLPQSSPMLMGGKLALGPYRQGWLDLLAQMYGTASAKDLLAAIDAVMKASTGDHAIAMNMANGMGFTQLFGVADARAADAAITALLKAIGKGRTLSAAGMDARYVVQPDLPSHDGVTIHALDGQIDLGKLPSATRAAMAKMIPGGAMHVEVATFNRLGLVAMGANVAAQTTQVIDAASGRLVPAGPSPEVARAIDGARKRRDSLIATIDMLGLVAAMTQQPLGSGAFVMALGFADRNAHLRFELPVTLVRAMRTKATGHP